MKNTLDKPEKSGEIHEDTGINRRPDGTFMPGQSPNPAGKPKGTKHFTTLFQELLKEQITLKGADGKPMQMTMLKAMGLAMARKAMRGDVSAFNAVSDRLDGKPSQDIDLEVSTPPVPIYGGKSTNRKSSRNISGRKAV